MRKLNRTVLIAFLALCLGLALLLGWLSAKSDPKLALRFLTCTNDTGRWMARFSLTNEGNATAISFPSGEIEVVGQSKPLSIACRSAVHRLAPGQGDVIEVFLPQRIDGRWRFTCLYALHSIRSRIYDWQWGKNGPGARANWLVPKFLKGVPLTVKGTSDWIEDAGTSSKAENEAVKPKR